MYKNLTHYLGAIINLHKTVVHWSCTSIMHIGQLQSSFRTDTAAVVPRITIIYCLDLVVSHCIILNSHGHIRSFDVYIFIYNFD